MLTTDVFVSIEALSTYQLYELVKPIYSKIETLGKILHIDMTLVDSVKRVLHYAGVFYSLWTEADDNLENKDLKESCMELLGRVAGDTITNLRDAISLSKEIMDELIMKIKSAQ